MSFTQYDDFLKEHKLSTNTETAAMVKRVGQRIQEAVEQYFAQQNMSDRLEGYKWDFNLVESDEMNAWCMPGGKVVFYTGLLPVTQNEAGMAVVMGHEIAHAVADHGNERMSQGMLLNLGGMALEQAISSQPAATQALFMKSFGVGTEVGVILPFSRAHEAEADHLGLIFMAMAGYDPNEAVGFWERMAASKKEGAKSPQFLSTHPSDETRIGKIKELLPEAMGYYKKRS